MRPGGRPSRPMSPRVHASHAEPRALGAPKALGELLKERGLLTAEQLDTAIARQQTTSKRLGHLLVEMGFVTPEAVLEVLSQQLGVATVRVNAYTVNPEALRALPEKVARRHTAFPLQKVGTTLVVALASPKDLTALDDLRFASGCEIRTMLALEEEILSALDRYYRDEWLPTGPDEDTGEVKIDSPTAMLLTRDEAAERSAVTLLERVIARAATDAASDIHFEPRVDQGARPRRHRSREGAVGDGHRRAPRAAGRPVQRDDWRSAARHAQFDVSDRARRESGPAAARQRPPAPAVRRRRPVRSDAGRVARSDPPIRGNRVDHRSDRQRQDVHAVCRARRARRNRQEHRHDRGSRRVRAARRQPGPDERQSGIHFCEGAPRGAAPGSGRDHGRRDPRPRDAGSRDRGVADGAPRAFDAAHEQRGRYDRAAARDGARAVPAGVGRARDRRATARAPDLHDVPDGGRNAGRAARHVPRGRSRNLLPRDGVPRLPRHRLPRAHRHLRDNADERRDPRSRARARARQPDLRGGAPVRADIAPGGMPPPRRARGHRPRGSAAGHAGALLITPGAGARTRIGTQSGAAAQSTHSADPPPTTRRFRPQRAVACSIRAE
ncbi:MAG: hypothetical protein DMF86_21425 [Acidobacteria bacterium]|nr:MAG: hypothetical protein DMF86_21425 [Acidobacteriota bacterium]